jgi:hypothetical protein
MGLDTIYCILYQQFHKNGFHRDEQSKVAVDSPWPVCSLHGMFFTLRRINDSANYLSSILFGDLFQRRSPLFFLCVHKCQKHRSAAGFICFYPWFDRMAGKPLRSWKWYGSIVSIGEWWWMLQFYPGEIGVFTSLFSELFGFSCTPGEASVREDEVWIYRQDPQWCSEGLCFSILRDNNITWIDNHISYRLNCINISV